MSVACSNPLFIYARKPSQAATWHASITKIFGRLVAPPRSVEETTSFASTPKCDTRAYAELHDLVKSFSDSDSELHVDDEAIEQAQDFLWKLVSFDAPPPSVFSHGGDAIVFVWKKEASKDYIYYADNIATVINIPNDGQEREINFDLSDSYSTKQLAMYIGT